MRRDTFHNHVAAKDHIIQADRNMTGTVPGQMDQLEGADPHTYSFVGEVYGDGMIDRLRKSINAEDLVTRLFSESRVGQEGSETPTKQGQSSFVIRHGLQIQFMDADLGPRDRLQS